MFFLSFSFLYSEDDPDDADFEPDYDGVASGCTVNKVVNRTAIFLQL